MMKKFVCTALSLVLLLAMLSGCALPFPGSGENEGPISLENVPDYSGEPYVEINGNIPFFTDEEKVTKSFENYAPLDILGRAGVAYACVGRDLMPTEERDFTLDTSPSGWKYKGKSNNTQYDVIPGWLYNRCHLIGWQLTAEGDNELNLITGTRYLNTGEGERGMLLFENLTADYIKETGNHVLYRVTPIYDGNDLVASGILMEGLSVEDDGEGVCFCVYLYNVQPGIEINYANGTNRLSGDTSVDLGPTENETPEVGEGEETPVSVKYILNTSSKKYHLESCSGAATIKEENKGFFDGLKSEFHKEYPNYTACGTCKPDGE